MENDTLRMTTQRKILLEELLKAPWHPTADELHGAVRKRLPRISLATVYRNLEMLAEKGAILRLDGTGPQRRYDGNPRNHAHFRCLSCGRVKDVHGDFATLPDRIPEELRGCQIHRVNLEWVGVCPECAPGDAHSDEQEALGSGMEDADRTEKPV